MSDLARNQLRTGLESSAHSSSKIQICINVTPWTRNYAIQESAEVGCTSSQNPFDSFPPELLAKCFLALKEDRGSGKYNPYRWINVTLVCRHWHDVALSSSTLWTDISTKYGLEAVRKLLRLSKVALLKVNIRPPHWTPGQDAEKVLRLIQTHAPRIQRLAVIVGPDLDPFTILDLRSYGRLNKLMINSVEIPASALALGGSAEPFNPPPLKQLVLFGCCVPSNSWVLTNLTLLDINLALSTLSDEVSSVEVIFATLRHCPALEFLILVDFMKGVYPGDEVLPVDKLALPSLATIVVKNITAHQCALFFDYLSLPENVSWFVIVTEYDRYSEADVMRLPSSPHKSESFMISAKLENDGLIMSGDRVLTPTDSAALNKINNVLTFTVAYTPPPIYLDLLNAFDMAGWSNMTEFIFEYNQNAFRAVDRESAWSHLLFRMPELRVLRIVFTYIDIDDALTAGLELLAALSPTRLVSDDEFPAGEADVDWDADDLLLPCLSVFTLKAERIGRFGHGTPFWDRLNDFVKFRDQHRRSLEKVELRLLEIWPRAGELRQLDKLMKYRDLFI
ncbi:hypothetical protein DFH11DRAFT_760486 [Phellopilus nigrolimitatus]|nr:hypothetical protein DFH11DRAFT_760486 [Phellopilus nigrolimitatus]